MRPIIKFALLLFMLTPLAWADSTVTVTVPSSSVTATLTNFPTGIDLSTMPAAFWSGLAYSDGRDIRVKDASGNDLPFDLVIIDTTAKTGYLFAKQTLSSTASTTFVIHFGDSSLSAIPVTATNGRNAVWSDYERVLFFNAYDISGPMADHTGKGTMYSNNVNLGAGFTTTNASPNINATEGVAFDGTYWYTTTTTGIYKYDASYSLVASNTSAASSLGVTHLGSIDVNNGVLYVAAEDYSSTVGGSTLMQIAEFHTSDLSFISSKNVASYQNEISGVAVDTDDGVLWAADYYSGAQLYKYSLSDLSYIGTVTLASAITDIQGLVYWKGALWVSAGNNGSNILPVVYVSKDGTYELSMSSVDMGGEGEDITHDSTHLWRNSGNGSVYELVMPATEAGSGAFFNGQGELYTNGVTNLSPTWTIAATMFWSGSGCNCDSVTYNQSGTSSSSARFTQVISATNSNKIANWDSSNSYLLSGTVAAASTTYRVHSVYNGNTRCIYVNGTVTSGSAGTTMPPAAANALDIGGSGTNSSESMHGNIGFVYLRGAALSQNWISAEDTDLHSPATFYTVSGVVSSATYRHRLNLR